MSKEAISKAERGKPKVELSPDELAQKNKCTLFVGNIPMSITKRQFETPFKQFGKITSSRFRSCPVNDKYKKKNKIYGVINKDFVEGVDAVKLTQNGYIVFATAESVGKAIESGLSNTDIFKSGHSARLDFVVKEEGPAASSGAVKKFDRKKSIYIPHIPTKATEADVTAAVEAADESLRGTVRSIRIVRSEKAGTFAFVLFSERTNATKAVKVAKIDYQFSFDITKTVEVRLLRVLKDEEVVAEKKKKLEEFSKSAKIAAKKSLSRMKWQARITNKGMSKVVSVHAMSRQERQEKMSGAARRIFNKDKKVVVRKS